jgi:hypothetical protein
MNISLIEGGQALKVQRGYVVGARRLTRSADMTMKEIIGAR